MARKLLVPVLVVIAVLVALYWITQRQQAPVSTAERPAVPVSEPTTTPPAVESHPVIREEAPVTAETSPDGTAASAPTDTAPVVPAPSQLDGSDGSVLQAASDLSPSLEGWLLPQEQLRKWVALVDLVAEGKFPVKDRPLSYELPPFRARKEDDRFWLEPASFSRKDALVVALTTIPPERAAHYFHAWEPLLQKAHEELGEGGQFRDRLLQAIRRVNAVQPLTGDTELKASIVTYQYLDPIHEQASALEKLLWRLGPDNSARLQNYLRQLAPLL
ncbi:MAG TPA: DUF3014 domain-containing protein [Dongiaceae bacterium]|nr:DUF3014 domain-containing protein [Dongiaceae bacterium]